MPTVKQYYLYYDGSLPEKGWFQCCTMCNDVTSRLNFYKIFKTKKNLNVEIYNYLCLRCKKKLSKEDFLKTYKINSDELISDNLDIIDP